MPLVDANGPITCAWAELCYLDENEQLASIQVHKYNAKPKKENAKVCSTYNRSNGETGGKRKYTKTRGGNS